MKCTHIVLYADNVDAARRFYVEQLGCGLRRFSSEEQFLSIGVGAFVINFDGSRAKLANDSDHGAAHLGFEVETRATVDGYAQQLHALSGFQDKRDAALGPYRFYINDPNGYTIEIHTWDGVKE